VGIVREAVIGRVLGSGADADVYVAGFRLPDFLGYLLAGGALSIVFIPIFNGYLERGEEDAGWDAFSVIANFLLVAVTLATVLMWIGAPQLVGVVAPGFSPERLDELVRVTRIMLPAQVFHIIGGLLGAVLMARDQHTFPALAPLLYTVSIVAFGLGLGPGLGAEGFAWGVLVGSVLGPFGLPLYGCLKTGLSWRPRFSIRHPDFRRYLWLSLPIMLAFSVIVVDDWVLTRLGSAVEDGTVARLHYAKTLMKVPMGVFGLATGVAAFPTLTRLVARGDTLGAYATLTSATRTMLVMACAAQAAVTVAGEEIATVIWGTARFTPEALAEIGTYCGWFCLGLWGWAAAPLVARGFYALQMTWLPSLVGSAVMVLAYPVYVTLCAVRGGEGLAMASTVAITAYTATMAVLLRRKLAADEPPKGLFSTVLRLLLAAGLGIALGTLGEQAIGHWPAWLRGAASGTVAGSAALGAAWLLRVQEVEVLSGLVLGRIRRRLGR